MTISFDSLPYSTIQEIKRIRDTKKPFKVWCDISELEDPKFKGKKLKMVSSATLIDDKGHKIKSTRVSDNRHVYLLKRLETGMPIEVIGKILRRQTTNGYVNDIRILRTREGDHPLRKLKASKQEIQIVKRFLKQAESKIHKGDRWYLLNVIRDAVIARLKIRGLDKNKRLSDTITAMILQAISCGEVENASGKVHVCVIGPPGNAKNYASKLVSLLILFVRRLNQGVFQILV